MKWFVCVVFLSIPAIGLAQSPVCGDSTVHFEFQMSARARWRPDTLSAVHPTEAIAAPANLVQFVVDTLGVPQPRTFRALRVADSALVAEARQALPTWRYTPGLLNGCHVRQLVQTPIGR